MSEYIERGAAIKAVSENDCEGHATWAIKSIPAADAVPGQEFRQCRNELCLRCGDYKQRHLGACDGCRWRADND